MKAFTFYVRSGEICMQTHKEFDAKDSVFKAAVIAGASGWLAEILAKSFAGALESPGLLSRKAANTEPEEKPKKKQSGRGVKQKRS